MVAVEFTMLIPFACATLVDASWSIVVAVAFAMLIPPAGTIVTDDRWSVVLAMEFPIKQPHPPWAGSCDDCKFVHVCMPVESGVVVG
jgi:hypothetical protein